MDKERLESILVGLGIKITHATRNAVNVDCPFCADTNSHCGVFLSNLRFHCWKCRRTGTLRGLLRMMGFADTALDAILSGFPLRVEDMTLRDQVAKALTGTPPPAEGPRPPVSLPINAEPVTADAIERHPLLREFLSRRQLYLDTCESFDARWGGNTGDYAHRMILPVYDDHGRLAAFQARDATGRARTKYLTEGRVSELLYWTDLMWWSDGIRRLYVVEGVYDAWRMGINAVATFTHGLSQSQRRMLLTDPRIDEVVFAWDGDSYDISVKAAQETAPLKRAGAVRLPLGQDPDGMGWRAVKQLEVQWA